MSLDAIAKGVGIMNMLDQMDANDQAREYENNVSSYMKGFQEQGEAFDPGDNYDGKAFMEAKTAFASSMMQDEQFKKLVFERQKRDMKASHEAILETGKKADGLRALGMNDKALDMMISGYEAFPDGGDASYVEKEDGTIDLVIEFPNGSKEVSNFQDKEKLWEGLQGHMKSVSDPAKFNQTYMGVRQQHIMNNAQQMSNPTLLTNDDGEKLYQVKGLIDTATGKPMNKTTPEGIEVTNGQYFFDPKHKTLITSKMAQERGFISLDDAKTMSEIGENKATAAKEKNLGLKALAERDKATNEKAQSTEGKLAADLVSSGIFKDQGEAMRFAVEIKQAENLDAVVGKLMQAGMTPDEPEYKDIMESAKKLRPDLPEPKRSRGIPNEMASAHKSTKPQKATPPKQYPDAKQGEDGNWYVERNGKKYMLQKKGK